MEYAVLYNPLAGSGRCAQKAQALCAALAPETCVLHDLTQLQSYAAFFSSLPMGASLLLCGGDGTLNRFANDTRGIPLPCPVYYCAAGSGNDFLRDIGAQADGSPVRIDPYLRALPEVTVNGETRCFLNGVGYGIDGYCCEVGDALRARSSKPVNYAAIAVKGLLFHYHPTAATVTVNGVEHRYQNVWLAPTMNGRFYGGGMMPAPQQERLGETVTVMVYHCAGKLKTLRVFPSIFKDEHVRRTEMGDVLTGHDVLVTFDRPTPLQIDGETICGVRSYRVHK